MKYVCRQFGEILHLPQCTTLLGRLSKQNVLQIIQSQDITVESVILTVYERIAATFSSPGATNLAVRNGMDPG